MRAGFDRWWLLPFGILTVSALITLCIAVFGAPGVGNPSGQDVAAGSGATDCSGASADDFSCYSQRYRALVRDADVRVAFEEIRDDYVTSEYVKINCHDLTHTIGYAAAVRYGDVAETYERGDGFCQSGYYHGATQAFIAAIGTDELVEKADALCAEVRKSGQTPIERYNCPHGLGHGFMTALDNELFEALEACDSLSIAGERELCYNGVFMENLMVGKNSNFSSGYLDFDRPLYPCIEVEHRYKEQCYAMQTPYVLYTQGDDFTAAFELCATAVEEEFRPSCYDGLGTAAAGHSIRKSVTEAAQIGSTERLCELAPDEEARAICIEGAVKQFIYHYDTDTQARAFCQTLDANSRRACLQTAEEY